MKSDDNRHTKKKTSHKTSPISLLIINTLTTIFIKSDDNDEKKPIIL